MGVYRGVTQDNATINKGTLYDVTLVNPHCQRFDHRCCPSARCGSGGYRFDAG